MIRWEQGGDDARNTSEISWLFYKDCGDLPDDGTWGDGKHSEAIARGILHGAAALLHVICGLWEWLIDLIAVHRDYGDYLQFLVVQGRDEIKLKTWFALIIVSGGPLPP